MLLGQQSMRDVCQINCQSLLFRRDQDSDRCDDLHYHFPHPPHPRKAEAQKPGFRKKVYGKLVGLRLGTVKDFVTNSHRRKLQNS